MLWSIKVKYWHFWANFCTTLEEITLKVCPIENNTNLDSIFDLVKVQKLLLFFYLRLTWLLAHDITKEFWKNSHFENMRAVFLLSCQNSLRWEKSLICHWNIDSWRQKLSFGCVMVPKNNQNIIKRQYRIHLVRTITIRGAILVKIENFMHENA